MEKESFIGKSALTQAKEKGSPYKLRSIIMKERAIARQGYEVYDASQQKKIGLVTSGTLSPTLEKSIAIAYISETVPVESPITVKIRSRFYAGEIIRPPFYKRERKKNSE